MKKIYIGISIAVGALIVLNVTLFVQVRAVKINTQAALKALYVSGIIVNQEGELEINPVLVERFNESQP